MRKMITVATLLMVSSAQTWGVTPEQIFSEELQESHGNKKGLTVRKGTIKALIDNVLYLNNILEKNNSKMISEEELKIQQTIKDIQESIPLLEDVFIFDVFPAEDWFESVERPGNIMVGILYLKKYPEQINPSLKKKIKGLINQNLHPVLRTELGSI